MRQALDSSGYVLELRGPVVLVEVIEVELGPSASDNLPSSASEPRAGGSHLGPGSEPPTLDSWPPLSLLSLFNKEANIGGRGFRSCIF